MWGLLLTMAGQAFVPILLQRLVNKGSIDDTEAGVLNNSMTRITGLLGGLNQGEVNEIGGAASEAARQDLTRLSADAASKIGQNETFRAWLEKRKEEREAGNETPDSA